MARGPHGDVPIEHAIGGRKSSKPFPWKRDDETARCESCGRRRRDIDLTNGVCRCCLAQADADHAYEYAREQWEQG